MATWKKVVTSGSAAELSSLALTTQLAVEQGGTGAVSLTSGGVLLGTGTSAIATTGVIADGSIIIGDGSGAPTILSVGADSSGITKLGTVSAGTWQGTVIASNKLDAQTAHLDTNQTFTGLKTFQGAITGSSYSGSVTSTGSFGLIQGDGSVITNLPNAAINSVAGMTSNYILTATSATAVTGEADLQFDAATGIFENKAGVGSKISGSIQSTGSFGHIVGTTYAGDGSGLSGIETDIDSLNAFNYPTQTLHTTQDHFLVSDAGTSKKLPWGAVTSSLFGYVSGDASIASTGVITLTPGIIDNADINASAAIVYSKLSLNNTITNNDLAGSIADSKLSTINTAGKVSIDALEIDGASEMGAALVDADLFIVDDGGAGTERSMLASRIPTYVFSQAADDGSATIDTDGAVTLNATSVSASFIGNDFIDGITDVGGPLQAADEFIIGDDSAAGDPRKTDLSRVGTFLGGAGLDVTSGVLSVGLEGNTIAIANDGIKVAAGNITDTELAFNTGQHLTTVTENVQFSSLTITNDLTVQGTTTTLDTQNLLVEDPMIFAATGSAANNVDAGLIVQSGSNDLTGSAIFHQKLGQRWAVALNVPASSSVVTPEQFVTTVAINQPTPPDSTSGSYGEGEMYIEAASKDIWIRTS